ncbi:MAG TPA: flagellar hook-basal body complex protein FliE [Planctomycetes bacterium]|nr:flagellar hook-basal body complex protein FliE [Planctomycetota bacterium]HIN79460.1 flagellar hook-basal body complex protein FliE [Planctomycetota bacterium]
MSIESSQPVQPTPPVGPTSPVRLPASQQDSGPSFQEVLANSIREVNTLQEKTESVLQALRLGNPEEVTKVMSQVEKVDLAFKILQEVQEKLVAAYQELNQLRV